MFFLIKLKVYKLNGEREKAAAVFESNNRYSNYLSTLAIYHLLKDVKG